MRCLQYEAPNSGAADSRRSREWMTIPVAGCTSDLGQVFENHSKTIIILERLMLEASGFDFRNRYPQELLIKVAKRYDCVKMTVGRTGYNISLDMYRTFGPLKQTNATMALSCLELAGRIHEEPVHEIEEGAEYDRWCITREEVMGKPSYIRRLTQLILGLRIL